LYAQHSVGWVGYYSYFYEVLNLKNNVDEEYYNILQNMTKMHWFLLYANYCGIIRKPLYVKQNDRFQLHSENSPVIKYRSGWEIYALHGILMPKEIVMTSADKLDPKLIFKEKNVDIRREIIRKIGIERLISKLGAKSIEKNDNYELLNFDIIDGRYRPFLKMRNPSVDTWHIEGVHPSCDTIEKALAWRDGEEVYERPGILT